MNCNQCGTQYEGKVCPNCGTFDTAENPVVNANVTKTVAEAKKKKPVFKKWWFWVIIAVVTISIIANSGEGDETSTNHDTGNSTTQSQIGDEINNTTDNKPESSKVTVADFSAMSKSDVENWAATNKVTVNFSEDYSDAIASGSVISQNKKANETVNEGAIIKVVISKGKKPSMEYQNALKKAESYSKLMHMSKKAIYDQLTSEYGEKFPADAAQYAIDHLDD